MYKELKDYVKGDKFIIEFGSSTSKVKVIHNDPIKKRIHLRIKFLPFFFTWFDMEVISDYNSYRHFNHSLLNPIN